MHALTRRAFTRSLGALATLPAVGRAAHASGAARSVTVASLFGDDKPETRIWRKIQALVDARLPGRFDFAVSENAALGGEKEVAEGVRLGSVQASVSTVSALSGWVPASQILDLPFLFRDAAHVQRVVDGPIGQDLKADFAGQGFIVLGFINYGARHLLAKTPIALPKDVAGKRIRVIQSPLHTALWQAYGALPTPLPITETYNALKTGIVDLMDLTKSAYAGFKLYEVVPWVIETAHIWATGVVYVAADFWNSLNADEQSVLAAAGKEGAAYFNQLMVEDEAASMQKATAAGCQTMLPQDRPAWVAGAEGVWSTMAGKVGGIEKIRAIIAS